MLKLIKPNSMIEWLIANNKLEACRLNGFYADKINGTTYLVFTDHSTLRMKVAKKGEHFIIARFLNFAVQ